MRMARRLVEVNVHAQHEVQLAERLRELAAIRRAEHRIARDGDERADLAVSRRQDLFSQRDGRQLAVDRGQPTHPAVAQTQPHARAAAWGALGVARARGGLWEERAARAV